MKRLIVVGGLALGLGGLALCSRNDKGTQQASAARDDDCRKVVPYAPRASEVPLPEDFTRAAERLVVPDNYKKQLTRIERELAELADADPAGEAVELERGTSAARP